MRPQRLEVEATVIPKSPLDVLAQQIVATVASVAPTHAAVTSNAPGASSLTVNERNDTAQNVTRAAPRRNADR